MANRHNIQQNTHINTRHNTHRNTRHNTHRNTRHNTHTFNCIQINLGRGRNATQELKHHTFNTNTDLIFIHEPYTGANNTTHTYPGYTIFQFPMQSTVKASVLIKDNLTSAIGITEFSNPNLSIVKINTAGHKSVYIVSVYIEPRDDINDTLQSLTVFLERTAESTHLICGDLNGWHSFWGSPTNNRRGHQIADLILHHGLTVCNTGNEPTFTTTTHGQLRTSIIDITLVSDPEHTNVTNWRVNSDMCPSTEHSAIEFQVTFGKTPLSRNAKMSTFKYNTSIVKWDTVKDQFIQEISKHINLNTDIAHLTENSLENFIKTLTTAIQKGCDVVLPRSSGYRNRAPWWNEKLDDIKTKVLQVHHKMLNCKRRNRPLGNLIEQNKNLREEYAEAIRSVSTEHFREFCTRQNKEDVYSITNRIIKTTPLRQPPATLKLDNGTFTKNSQDTAQALLSKFFPDDTSEDTPAQFTTRSNMHLPMSTPNEPPFTHTEITNCLQQMNHKKAPGMDHLTSDICLRFAIYFPNLITELLNRCLSLCYFPDIWKIALAKIIPKPGKTDFTSSSSYRPIGLINVFGKLLEKLIINRLTHHLNITNSSSTMQFGFKQSTSTFQAINRALDVVRDAKSKGRQVLAVSLDIRAAFDHAWWPAIFRRLRMVNCPNNIYQILISYITNRSVYLNFADCQATKQMSMGCVQGSVCGPTLWNLILDELLSLNMPPGCHIQAYADDILLITHNKNLTELENHTNSALTRITAWGDSVKLTFAPDKTFAIGFTNKAVNRTIKLNEHNINFTDHIKYLGVIIDRKLTFTKHVDHTIEKAKKLLSKLTIFVKPTWGIQPENIKIIYQQVIEPIVYYAASIWSGALKYIYINKKLLSLERLFALKIIRGFRTINTPTAISLAELTPLPSKILAMADRERSKINGYSSFLPSDIPLEMPTPTPELLHPSLRKGIEFYECQTSGDIDTHCPPENVQIYTDGSKHDDKVGAAVVVIKDGNTIYQRKIKLHNCCSVFQAEMYAILHSCKWILLQNNPSYTIFSDCKSALTELSNPYSTKPLTTQIHKLLLDSANAGLEVTFAWIKAHTGITGNELADTAAKSAADLHCSPEYTAIPISFIKYQNSLSCRKDASELYNKSTYIKTLLPTFDHLQAFLSHIKPNFPITQFLSNHGYHKSYLHRFHITADDICPCDPQASISQSFSHLFHDCPRFAHTRYNHLATCHKLTNPYDLTEIIQYPECIETFGRHVHNIVIQLKKFNTPESTS